MAIFNLSYSFYNPSRESFESFFDDMINSLERLGYPFSPQQKHVQYFYELFPAYYKVPFGFNSIEDYYKACTAEEDNKLFHPMKRDIAVLRDTYLLQKIAENLKKHDRIFIQAGAFHLKAIAPHIEKMVKAY
jgi:hypothetical protein